MPILKVILKSIFLALLVSGSIFAADKPATPADLEKLQEQIRIIDKDLIIQKEISVVRLDAQDKRLGDIALTTAQQANHLAAISNQTTTVGNYIGVTSVLITVFVFGAGFITYISAKSKAKDEARDASALWFKQNAADLQKEIEKLRAEAQKVSEQIESHGNQIASEASSFAELAAASRAVLDSARAPAAGTSREAPNQQALQTVRDASDALKEKPESQFTAADYFARGLASFSSENYQSALSAFEQAITLSKADATANKIAQYLFAKGVTLGALGKSEEAIAVYDEIDRRFGKDESPGVREQVAGGLFNKGATLGALGKSEEAIAVYDEIDRRFGKDESPGVRERVAMGLFNKGGRLGALGKSDEAIAVYDEIDRRFGKDESPGVRERVAKGLFNKGVRLGVLGKSDEAIAVYDEIDRRFGKDESPGVREKVAMGLVNKGAALGALGKSDEAIAVYDEIDRRFGKDESPGVRAQVAKGLVNKGAALGALGKSEEAIAVYDEIDRRFGKDESPGVREQVAIALNGLGFAKILLAKARWPEEAQRHALLSASTPALERALMLCAQDDRAMVLGNLGYSLFLAGQHHAARAPTLECLQLGGQKQLDGQRADTQQHRVEVEDSQYEKLLDELWRSLPPTGAIGLPASA